MSIDYGSGVETTYTYDPDTFRLTRQHSLNGTISVQDLNTVYGPGGRIYSVRDEAQDTVFFSNAVTKPLRRYTYDGRYRLVRAIGREIKVNPYGLDQAAVPGVQTAIPSATTDVHQYTRTYTWDAAGNMLTMAASSAVSWTRTMAYATDSNRMTSVTHGSSPTETITYDQHGQMDGLPVVRELRWDAGGNLRFSKKQSASTERQWYVYAGVQRVRKITETLDNVTNTWWKSAETLYLGGLEIYRTFTSTGLDLEREHLQVSDGAHRVVEVETKTVNAGTPVSSPTSLFRYALANATMSVTVELDDTGSVVSYEEYHPFGTSAYVADTRSTSGAKRYRYQGKERDAETGLYYYGYRYYAPWVTRWTCADPGGTVDGLNLYGFVGGDPTSRRDSDGRREALPNDLEPVNRIADSTARSVRGSALETVAQASPLVIASPGARNSITRQEMRTVAKHAWQTSGSAGMLPLVFVHGSDFAGTEPTQEFLDWMETERPHDLVAGGDALVFLTDATLVTTSALGQTQHVSRPAARTVNEEATRRSFDLARPGAMPDWHVYEQMIPRSEPAAVGFLLRATDSAKNMMEVSAHEGFHALESHVREQAGRKQDDPTTWAGETGNETLNHLRVYGFAFGYVEHMLPVLSSSASDSAIGELADQIWSEGFHPSAPVDPAAPLADIAGRHGIQEDGARRVFFKAFISSVLAQRSGTGIATFTAEQFLLRPSP